MSSKKPRELKTEYVTLFNGHLSKSSRVVGYCYNTSHKGYISKTLLKKHECLEKNCSLLERCNPDFWEEKELIMLNKNKRKNAIKAKQKEWEDFEKNIITMFEQHDQVYVTSVKEIGPLIRITYICNTRVDLSEVIKLIQRKYQRPVYLKEVKTSESVRRQLITNRVKKLDTDPV